MKKRRFLLIALMCCFVFAGSILVACNGEDSDFTVSFDTQGGSNIAEITVGNGQVIGEVAPPAKQCARFIGFALDAGGERMWNLLTDTVSADITLYAIWEDTHTWGEWTELFAPACETDGEKGRSCEVCGKTENEAIDALGHDYAEEYTEDVAPGCETTGSESRHCTRCGATTDSREIEALGHNYMVWAHDDTKHWQTCSRCGAVSEKTAHVYDADGKCECGAIAATLASEFTFTDLGNNTWGVDGYSGSDSAIVIPSRYNGGKVISIGREAFLGQLKLTSVIIPDSVTSIALYAFRNCTRLTSVSVPDSVTSIGVGAFSGCSSLKSITIPFVGAEAGKTSSDTYQYPFGYIFGTTSYTGGTEVKQYYYGSSTSSTTNSTYYIPSPLREVTVMGGNILRGAFYNCSGLTSVTIPDSVTSIGDYAFSGSTAEIVWGDDPVITEIGEYAFAGYKGTSITIPDSVTSIGDYAFSGCTAEIVWGDDPVITEIGEYAFAGYKGTSITIPDGVTSIGLGAFVYCTGLTSVTIGDSVTSIGYYAFEDCTGLTSINIPDGVKSIGYGAFMDCTGLTSVTIGDGVTSIGDYAFAYCSGLTSITIPNSVTSIGDEAFRYCTGLTSVTIGNGVTSIGLGAFAYCSGLTSITVNENNLNYKSIDGNVYSKDGTVLVQYAIGKTANTFEIPDSVTSIGDYAFYNCTGLTSVTIGAGVTSIGESAFEDCTGLTSVTIGEGVTSIGSYAFRGCTAEIVWGDDPVITEIGVYAFAGYKGTSITIPDGVTSIGSYAFSGCTAEIVWGDDPVITEIGDDAFAGYKGTSIVIPAGVTSIGDYAFYDCTGLTEISWNAVSVADFDYNSNVFDNAGTAGEGIAVTFGESVEKIPAYLFYVRYWSYSPNIKSVIIGSDVTSIGDYAFSGCTAEIVWGDDPVITEIGEYAFAGYKGTSIVIPAGVTSIGDRAFYNCSGLTSVTIGDGVTSIGDWAFDGCTGLTSVTIGAGVTSIGYEAFSYCTGLTSVTFEETSGWFVSGSSSATSGTDISADLSDKSTAAEYLRSTYRYYYWKRNA